MSCIKRIITVPCPKWPSRSGIQKALIGCYGEKVKHPAFYDNPNGEIDRIWTHNQDGSVADESEWSGVFHKLGIKPSTSNFTEQLVVQEDGTEYVDQTVTLKLHGFGGDFRNSFESFKHADLFMALKMNNGFWQLFGTESPLRLSNIDTASGTNTNEFWGNTLTFKGQPSRLSSVANYDFAKYLDEEWRIQS